MDQQQQQAKAAHASASARSGSGGGVVNQGQQPSRYNGQGQEQNNSNNHSQQKQKVDTSTMVDGVHPDCVESSTVATYHPPGCGHGTSQQQQQQGPPPKPIQWVYNPSDGSVLQDHKGRPISVDKLLATKPLRGELQTRPGPGGKKLLYISGEGISRTLNDIFGFDGWNLEITKVQREECIKDEKGRYTVVYTAIVRLTHKESGAYKEDCGSSDSTDRNFGTAISHAIKGSVTDAMKRCARHFGDKLGNSLYERGFNINKAPTTLKQALDNYDIERANTKFGFQKDLPSITASSSSSSATGVASAPAPPPPQSSSHGSKQITMMSNTSKGNGSGLSTSVPSQIVPRHPPQQQQKPHATAATAQNSSTSAGLAMQQRNPTTANHQQNSKSLQRPLQGPAYLQQQQHASVQSNIQHLQTNNLQHQVGKQPPPSSLAAAAAVANSNHNALRGSQQSNSGIRRPSDNSYTSSNNANRNDDSLPQRPMSRHGAQTSPPDDLHSLQQRSTSSLGNGGGGGNPSMMQQYSHHQQQPQQQLQQPSNNINSIPTFDYSQASIANRQSQSQHHFSSGLAPGPPKTSSELLMSSSLFQKDDNGDAFEDSTISTLPQTARGRTSIGDGKQIQPVAQVTPVSTYNNHPQPPNNYNNVNRKRPPLSNVQNLDPTNPKKQQQSNMNPYVRNA